MSAKHPDELLAVDMARFYADPLGFVLYAYPWDTDSALQVCELPAPYSLVYETRYGPDKWACDLLSEIGEAVRERGFNGRDAVMPIRVSVASGHGIGKSALTAWLVDWLMSTRPHCKGVVTANTAQQLSSKTWAELAKWTSKCITAHWFEVTTAKGASRMYHGQNPDSWRVDAQTCDETNSESFAGLHAANSTPFYLFDEGSAVPDKIFEVAEGGMTDGEPMMFMFGNPTRSSGKFYRTHHGERHRWITRQIDSRTVQITNKAQLQEWVDDYGVDSDFVKVRVRGMFPSISTRQFLSTALVDAAFGRKLRDEAYDFAPKILTCDPAWEGDDELVIGLRQGLAYRTLRVVAKNDNDVGIANILARLEDEHQADAVFVDGGFGTGIVSAGRTMNRDWTIVWFSSESANEGCVNKRAEMYEACRRWLQEGGSIPADPVLHDEMIAVETVPRMDGKIQLESKADMKKRGLKSPNRCDALVLSFAYPVEKKPRPAHPGIQTRRPRDYDPVALWRKRPQ